VKIFLPCFDTCLDGLDVTCKDNKITLLFFDKVITERQYYPAYLRAYYSPSHQEAIVKLIQTTLENEWTNLSDKEIGTKAEIINKVFSAIDLGGEHLPNSLPIEIALFELALYLDDEHEVFIVTNYSEKIEEYRKKWLKFREDNKPREENFAVINPATAIYLMASMKKPE